jgi:FlaA1/EpsC-like NDP-sugar epimerase
MKELFSYMFTAMSEFNMINADHKELMAFSTGLRDGEDLEEPLIYDEDSSLQSFYKQGFKHSRHKMDSQGRLVDEL